jgi:hypothetical protein
LLFLLLLLYCLLIAIACVLAMTAKAVKDADDQERTSSTTRGRFYN